MENKHESTAIVVIVLIVLLLGGVAVMGFFGGDKVLAEPIKLPEKTAAPSSLPTPVPAAGSEETEPAEETEPILVNETDFDAIYALHDPEEVVMTVDGKPVTWQDYYFAFYSRAVNMEQTFVMYQYYGMALGWEDMADEEGHSYAELVAPLCEQELRRILTAESVAEEENVSLLPEEEEAVQAEHEDTIAYICGEGGTEEEMFKILQEDRHLSPELYWRIMRFDALTQAVSRTLYGSEGEKLDAEQVLTWMEEEGILSADHILVATVDLSSYQPLDDAAIAEKTELARQIAEELQAIEDPAEREARFRELKEEYGEDPGAETGYVFGPGVMVQEFYDGAAALEEGQISDPIESAYGFHIILRRALQPEAAILTESGEENARALMAETLFNRKMEERFDAQVVEYVNGFTPPNVLDYQISVEY